MYHHYTKEEDNIILEEVKKRPENISKALITSSKKINRTVPAVRYHYYHYLIKNPSNKMFFIASSHKKLANYKVKRRGMKAAPEKNSLSKWQRIIAILFE